ncbi:hypothetical protein P5616_010675 [Priestia aryabhattai]|uniref:hypothetical protein n=1 Tax=Priestia aryabhattai TaxID=412384 RepID=UPI003138CD6F
MIGSAEMGIDGIQADGTSEPTVSQKLMNCRLKKTGSLFPPVFFIWKLKLKETFIHSFKSMFLVTKLVTKTSYKDLCDKSFAVT